MRAAQLILVVWALAAASVGSSIADFHLPPKSVFSAAMPRYPNVWFYLDASLAADHQAAVKLVTGELRKALHLRELRLPNSEGCDFEVRLEHFQPWEDSAHRALQHSHSFHLRYYYSDLVLRHLERVELEGRPFITRSSTAIRITPTWKFAQSAAGPELTRT
jgi:hypothetical protein